MKFSEYVNDVTNVEVSDADFWIRMSKARPDDDGEYLVTIVDRDGHQRVTVAGYKKYFFPIDYNSTLFVRKREVGVWSNINVGDKVVAWMPIPAPAKGEARIERKGNRVYYIDENGKKYIVYILAEFGAKTIDHSEPYHHMAVVVEYANGGSVCGYFYITGTDDEELLSCCKEYVHAI